jgi:hypothetical protein
MKNLVPKLNAQLEKIIEEIADLDKGIDKLINEQIAKQILTAFEQYATDIETLRRRTIKMQENEELKSFSWNPHEQCSKFLWN